jgi:hypothetical protein
MVDLSQIVTTAGVVILIIEGIKWLVRKINPSQEFMPIFYVVITPILNAVVPYALLWLGLSVDVPIVGSVLDLVKYIVLAVLGALLSFIGYNTGVKPIKEFAKSK